MKPSQAITILLLTLLPYQVMAQTISERLSGRILLQVEQNGEAWYVNPSDGFRYYMKDGKTAYEMMRSFGLGITDADLENISAVSNTDEMKSSASDCNNAFAKNQAGKILLQVQQHGEAWWVSPEKCLRIYLKDGEAAYTIMRFLGLGITNNDLTTISSEIINTSDTNPEAPKPTSVVPTPAEPAETQESLESLQKKLQAMEAQLKYQQQTQFVEQPAQPTPEPEVIPPAPAPYHLLTIDNEDRYLAITDSTQWVDCSTNICIFSGDIHAWKGLNDGKGGSLDIRTSKPLTITGNLLLYGSLGNANNWLTVRGIFRTGTDWTDFW